MIWSLEDPTLSDAKGRLRLPTQWAHYFGAPEPEPPMIDPRTPAERVREFFSGHDFRIVSLAQFRREWNRPCRRRCQNGDWT
jgi:hypothetical protein